MKVLIIDDTKSVHAFVRAIAKNSPTLSFHSTYNGAEGLEELKNNADYDLILLDWEMPVLDGPGTLKALQNIQKHPRVIMMTTKNSTDGIIEMLSLGAAEYIMKPFTIDILIEKIETVTGRSLSHAA